MTDAEERTTIAVRTSTRDRINAQRTLIDGGRAESADEILIRLLDELEALRGEARGTRSGKSSKASAGS